jgi:transglutaminase-like putative cysteine protease
MVVAVLTALVVLPSVAGCGGVLSAEIEDYSQESVVLENERHFQLVFTHTVENISDTGVQRQDVYCLVPQSGINQTVLGVTFDPQPTEFLADSWGQPVAHYVISEMPANSSLEIRWTADVVMTDLAYVIDPAAELSLADVPSDVLGTYTRNETKYNLASPVVKRAAREAVANSSGLYEQVRDIYQYVIDRLEYSREGTWDDASTVLTRGNGSCTEYVFVAIALYRANGIPARFVGGSRLRADDDYVDTVFHRAVEVFLPGYGWVPLDPTLGDTQEDAAAYFLQRYNSHLILATAGGRSDLVSWNYHSYLKVAESSDADQVESSRSMYWKSVASEPSITPVPPQEEPGLVVANVTIAMSTVTKAAGRNAFTLAVANVRAVDADGQPIVGATVSGLWSGLTADSDSAVTNSDGVVVLESDQIRNGSGTFSLNVVSVSVDGANLELAGLPTASTTV